MIQKGPVPARITDIGLAACLLAVGILPAPGDFEDHLTGDARSLGFCFSRNTTDIRFQLEKLELAWRMEQEKPGSWVDQNPEHPFAYAISAVNNLRHLTERVKVAKAKVLIKRGKSVAVVDPVSPQDVQDVFLQKIGV